VSDDPIITVKLTKEQAEELSEALSCYQDCGPLGAAGLARAGLGAARVENDRNPGSVSRGFSPTTPPLQTFLPLPHHGGSLAGRPRSMIQQCALSDF